MAFQLNTLKDVKDWLSKPENQHDTNLFVIKWKGNVPSIGKAWLKSLEQDGILEVVLREHNVRRGGGMVDDIEPTDEE